jgi:hypothetical protein
MKEYDFNCWINAREAQDLQRENASLKTEVERLRKESKFKDELIASMELHGSALQARIDNGQYGLAVVYDNDVLLAIENCTPSDIKERFKRAQGLERLTWTDCQKRGYEIISVLILEDEESEE